MRPVESAVQIAKYRIVNVTAPVYASVSVALLLRLQFPLTSSMSTLHFEASGSYVYNLTIVNRKVILIVLRFCNCSVCRLKLIQSNETVKRIHS